MKYLLPNQASQTLNLTLNEGRTYYATTFTHYLMVISYEDSGLTTDNTLAQVLTVVSENNRNTEVTLTTVGLYYPEQGGAQRYRYKVYGQNSSSNIDPTNNVVVGEVEQGLLIVSNGEQFYNPINGSQEEIIYA
jgi:hypothetical protein